MSALELVGWISSILVVWSLMQARVLRFRVMNLAGAALATVVNAMLGIWPFAAMNGVIAVIDVYWIWKLTRERHDEAAYEVVEVGVDDAYLRYQLRVHDEDIAATHPAFAVPATSAPGAGAPSAAGVERSAFLVLRGDETVGMVLVRDAGAGVGEVELDYVTERFRDFTPGEFVYRKSGIFAEKGFTRLRADAGPGTSDHYGRVGFQRVDGHWERPVESAA
ncbi:MAG: hypothetical protein MUF09_01045 [Candidatus Nanopelagicales bacterium]|nr:hypothetical protein [Candidatus Nanopelagicales bacterium]